MNHKHIQAVYFCRHQCDKVHVFHVGERDTIGYRVVIKYLQLTDLTPTVIQSDMVSTLGDNDASQRSSRGEERTSKMTKDQGHLQLSSQKSGDKVHVIIIHYGIFTKRHKIDVGTF